MYMFVRELNETHIIVIIYGMFPGNGGLPVGRPNGYSKYSQVGYLLRLVSL